jgi:antitoxin (DNA-binding transcriptional repressor) of toxin-antitoxin stability system
MKSVKVSELKNNLSRFLAYVRRGGTVRVYDRDTAIADLTPCGSSGDASDGESLLVELERAGILRRGTGKLPSPWQKRRLPRVQASVVEALLDERRNER